MDVERKSENSSIVVYCQERLDTFYSLSANFSLLHMFKIELLSKDQTVQTKRTKVINKMSTIKSFSNSKTKEIIFVDVFDQFGTYVA